MAPRNAARPAGPTEIGVIAELAREARREAQQYRGGGRWLATEAAPEPLEDHLVQMVADTAALVVAGFWEGEVVGYGWARRIGRLDGSSIARIEELFVTPAARSVGVGESLFDAVRQWAQRERVAGIDAFVLPGHRQAKNFFETFKMTAHALTMHTRLQHDPGE